MKFDVVVAGVGGQGVVSVTALLASSALACGLHVKQSEEHGMSQRGGAVVTHLRMADHPIHSDLIPQGSADLVLGLEPLESLRHLAFLAPGGTILSAAEPQASFRGYPETAEVLGAIRAIPGARVVEAEALARQSGAVQAANLVVIGAASRVLPLEPERIEEGIREAFARKGAKTVEANLKAFRAGRDAAACTAD